MYIATGVLLLALLGWLILRPRLGARNAAERELLRLVQNDQSTLDSLVNGELKRSPQLTREAAIKKVLSRLKYERAR